MIWQVHVDDSLRRYIVALVEATRHHPDLALGASPRGSLALFRAAQARAAIQGRDYVLPDDIQAIAALTLPHRCIVRPESRCAVAPQKNHCRNCRDHAVGFRRREKLTS